MRRLVLLTTLMLACGSDAAAPDAALQIRVPRDRTLLQSIATFSLRAERDSRVLAQELIPNNGSQLLLDNVPFGQRTVFTLDGITSAGDLVARGSSCPLDFELHGDPVSIYFSPVNFFASTPGAPTETRTYPVALSLATGNILIAGGQGTDGNGVMSAETFAPATGTFAVSGSPLMTPRVHAEIIEVPSVGALVVGGQASGQAPGELYDVSSQAFVSLTSPLLTAHHGHQMVSLPDGHILIIGGTTVAGVPGDQVVDVSFPAGVPQFKSETSLTMPLESHAAAVVVGVPVVFGGTNDGMTPLKDILVRIGGQFVVQAQLKFARKAATATALNDGSVLIVGGYPDMTGACGAEVFNPVTQESTCVPTSDSRTEHTATLLADGRVLVTGGLDPMGQPLRSVELFVPGVGFVAERPLGTPRHGHVAVPLCDGTVLVTGGGPAPATAEIYNPPAR
jgi:hypothetical protein